MTEWLWVLVLFALTLWGRSPFGHARYSLAYGSIVVLVALVASRFIGDWAAAGGMLALAARWLHLWARANEERLIFGATVSEMALMKKSFEHQHPGIPYVAPADREAMIARVREFKATGR